MADARSDLIEAVARKLEVPRLDGGEIDAVLSLAGAAAHGTGDRTAAPLCCYLAGLAAGPGERGETLAQLRAFVASETAGSREVTS